MVYETAISLGLVISAFILVYIGTKIKNEQHSYFQMLFMVIGLWILYSHLVVMHIIADNNGESAIREILIGLEGVYIWLTIFIMLMFMLMFVVSMMKFIGNRGKTELDE